MGIIVSILIGALAGFLAGKIMKGTGFGFWINLLVGIVGGHASRILALEGTVAQHTSDITALWDEVFDLKDRVAALDGGPDSGRTPPNP